MKLLKTIKRLVKESEDNLEQAIQNSYTPKEVKALEESYTESLNLLSLYESIENEKED
jgi:hypothetical protein